jgi:hypothetical protein
MVAGLIILFLLEALITRKSFELNRNITIEKSMVEVFNYLEYISCQNHWSPCKSTSDVYLELKQIDERGKNMLWGFTGRIPYPLSIFLLFMNFDITVRME